LENQEIIYGRNPVYEYLRNAAHGDVEELLVSDHSHGKIIDEILALARDNKIPVSCKDRGFFQRIAPSSQHQGIALKISMRREPDSEDIVSAAVKEKGVIVLLDQITDPHNTGAIIRTAEALGCRGIVIPRSRSAGITPAVVKAASGATAHISISTVANAASFIENAKKAGVWVIGTSDHGTCPLGEIGSIRPALVIIGSEGEGMRRLTEEKCDYIVSIPLKGKVSSLNASVAAGIVLYEIMKN